MQFLKWLILIKIQRVYTGHNKVVEMLSMLNTIHIPVQDTDPEMWLSEGDALNCIKFNSDINDPDFKVYYDDEVYEEVMQESLGNKVANEDENEHDDKDHKVKKFVPSHICSPATDTYVW